MDEKVDGGLPKEDHKDEKSDNNEESAMARKVGQEGHRSLPFREVLLDKYGWLRYDKTTRTAYCIACAKYDLTNALDVGVTEFRRVTGKRGTFAAHNKSAEHCQAMERMMSEERRGTVLHQVGGTN